MVLFHNVDPRYTSEAEGEARDVFRSFGKLLVNKLDDDGKMIDLVALNDRELAQTFKQYKYIGNQFMGSTQETHNEIAVLKNKIIENEHIILQKDLIIANRDLVIATQQNEMKLQTENWQLKLQLSMR